jgi:alkylation response protein AidB-like acyl-CoA dehydrogenase
MILPVSAAAVAAVAPPGPPSPPRASFAGTAPHLRFRGGVAKLIRDKVIPRLEEWEAAEALPGEFFRWCGAGGLLGTTIPAALGGRGLDFSYAVAQVEEFMSARATGPAVSLMVQSNGVCPLLARHGTPELCGELLGPLISGEAVGSLGATEPSGGSALSHTLRCTAERQGDEWVITGEKAYITNAPIADTVLLLARTVPGTGPLTMSLIAVPSDAPGFEVVAQHRKLGLGASPTGHLRLDRCRVPVRFTVGRQGHGYPHLLPVLCQERLLVAAGSVACARSVLEVTAAGLRGGARDAARPELARMHARLEAARAFVYAAGEQVCAGETDPAAAAAAKFALCEMAQRVAAECARIVGPRSALTGSGLDRVLRETRVLSVFAGTSETMRDVYGSRLATLMQQLPPEEAEC